jgi:hypothetical protein
MRARSQLRKLAPPALAAGVLLCCVGVALAAPGDPQRHFKPADQAVARSILLTKTDLGHLKWKQIKTDFSQPNPACFVKHYSLAALTVTGEAGFEYTYGITSVESIGHVFVTAAQAATAFAGTSKLGLARCYGSALAAQISKGSKGSPKQTAKVLHIEPVTFTGLGAPTRGFRIVLGVSEKGKKGVVPVDTVFVTTIHGRALGSLNFVQLGQPLSQPIVRSLVKKVAQRVKRQ